MSYSDLVVDAFILLRDSFFETNIEPIPFHLRDKRNTQDDPLDEHISRVLERGLKDATCQKSPGPLTSPDLVIYRPELCSGQPRETLVNDTSRIVAIEVKKLERTATGKIARATGMDYNTTPPCGTIRAYDADDSPLDIKGFYLFVAQEKIADQEYLISALALCDGDVLNEDFDLYLSIVSQRHKSIGLGTYGDGANRNRPMLIFANPLGASQLDRQATVVTQYQKDERIGLMYRIVRTAVNQSSREFFAYRKTSDVPAGWQTQTLSDPFPQPQSRVSTTQARGKFRLPIRPE
jgi:hypothetical protein